MGTFNDEWKYSFASTFVLLFMGGINNTVNGSSSYIPL